MFSHFCVSFGQIFYLCGKTFYSFGQIIEVAKHFIDSVPIVILSTKRLTF